MESKQSEKDVKNASQPAVEDSEEEENDILEESPCGRWLKRREEVEQNNIPGIDATYLAMDTEEGVEVVWNEVRFSERKYFKAKEEIISDIFDRLIQLEHPNIVKLHKYWIQKDADIPKVVFITEHMSSGSLKQYFKKTKRHDIKLSLQVWRRWCTQALSALCYLHSSHPSIIHGNINCDTIFISYNGLIKIGAIAPDAIHRHVKTVRANAKSNLHFVAPELGNAQDYPVLTPAVDIYSFGMCALEMAALEISTDEESSHNITEKIIQRTIDSLENRLQRDFIQQCLRPDPSTRPLARDLLFHPIIFEVPALQLFCAHTLLNSSLQSEQVTDDTVSRYLSQRSQNDRVVAEVRFNSNSPPVLFKQSDFTCSEVDKILEEVKNGALPLTAVMPTTRPPLVSRQRTISPEVIDDSHRLINTPDNPYDEETRRILYINCSLQPLTTDLSSFDVKIVIKLDDKINRQLTCEVMKDQFVPPSIAQELVYYGFINKDDKEDVSNILMETLNESLAQASQSEKSVDFQKSACLNSTVNSNMNYSQPIESNQLANSDTSHIDQNLSQELPSQMLASELVPRSSETNQFGSMTIPQASNPNLQVITNDSHPNSSSHPPTHSQNYSHQQVAQPVLQLPMEPGQNHLVQSEHQQGVNQDKFASTQSTVPATNSASSSEVTSQHEMSREPNS